MIYRPPGDAFPCPRCGEPIALDLAAAVAEVRWEREARKARRQRRGEVSR